jgi:hypothetical protein
MSLILAKSNAKASTPEFSISRLPNYSFTNFFMCLRGEDFRSSDASDPAQSQRCRAMTAIPPKATVIPTTVSERALSSAREPGSPTHASCVGVASRAEGSCACLSDHQIIRSPDLQISCVSISRLPTYSIPGTPAIPPIRSHSSQFGVGLSIKAFSDFCPNCFAVLRVSVPPWWVFGFAFPICVICVNQW